MSVCSGRAMRADSLRGVGRVEQAQLDLGRVRGEQREVDADAGPGGAERIRARRASTRTARLEVHFLCHGSAVRAVPSAGCRSAPNSKSATDYSIVRRIPVVEPGLRGVGVAAHFPESLVILGQELDLADPLRALPGVQLRRDHPARPAVLARQRLALPGVDQQHVVFDRALERQVGRVGDEACPARSRSRCTSTKRASSLGTASSAIVLNRTPRQ